MQQHDDEYFARRAAQHRLLKDRANDPQQREAHRRLAGAYERAAVRAMFDRIDFG